MERLTIRNSDGSVSQPTSTNYADVFVKLAGCNYDLIDTTYKYDRAVIELPTGEIIDGKVQNWRDYEDGDQIQVEIDGVTYLVHSSDVVLISN